MLVHIFMIFFFIFTGLCWVRIILLGLRIFFFGVLTIFLWILSRLPLIFSFSGRWPNFLSWRAQISFHNLHRHHQIPDLSVSDRPRPMHYQNRNMSNRQKSGFPLPCVLASPQSLPMGKNPSYWLLKLWGFLVQGPLIRQAPRPPFLCLFKMPYLSLSIRLYTHWSKNIC